MARGSMTVPIMTDREREALRCLLDYCADDERRDYVEQREARMDVSRHIWLDIVTLNRYLERWS